MQSAINEKPGSELFSMIGFWGSVFFLLFYSLTMITGEWLLSSLLLILTFGALLFLYQRQLWGGIKIKWISLPLVILLYVAGLFLIKNYSQSMWDWDSRAIWFFHAKIIELDGGLKLSSAWTHPSITWSHPDYPKLVPLLGAYLSHFSGGWNEQWAKLSVWLLMLPAFSWLFSFYQARLSFILLAILFFTLGQNFFWNGYVDGLLALYSACSLLLLGRYSESGRKSDLYSVFANWGILLSLKNEGMLIVLCMALTGFFYFRALNLISFLKQKTTYVFGFISILPFSIWIFLKKLGGIQSEFQFLTSTAMDRVVQRTQDGKSLWSLFVSMFFWERNTFKITLLVLGLSLTLCALKRFKVTQLFKIAVLSSLLYAAGIFVIYIFTPYPLGDHVRLSVDRVMLSYTMMMLTALYSLMTKMETRP